MHFVLYVLFLKLSISISNVINCHVVWFELWELGYFCILIPNIPMISYVLKIEHADHFLYLNDEHTFLVQKTRPTDDPDEKALGLWFRCFCLTKTEQFKNDDFWTSVQITIFSGFFFWKFCFSNFWVEQLGWEQFSDGYELGNCIDQKCN